MAAGSYERKMFDGGVPQATLSADINDTVLSLTVDSGEGAAFPDGSTGKFVIALGVGTSNEEKILVTSRSGDTFTLSTRGYDDTAGVAHTAGVTVDHVLDASTIDQANRFVNLQSSKGDIVAHDGSNPQAVAVGSDGLPLVADSTATSGVAWGQISSSGIATDAITSDKIAAGAVGTDEIAADAVNASKIAAGAVGADELAATGVTAGTYGDAANVAEITVDADGRITSATETAIIINSSTVSDATSANTVNTIVKRDASGNFSAGTITAALSGNATTATTATTAGSATTATTATNATNVDVVSNNSENTSMFITFVDGQSGNQRIEADNSLRYNPLTNKISAGLTGTADQANSVLMVDNSSENNSLYIPFVDGATGYQALESDSGLRYNPSTNTISAALSGNASSATQLANSRDFSITGDISATSVSFNGTGNVTLNASIDAGVVGANELATGIRIKTGSGTAGTTYPDNGYGYYTITHGCGTTPTFAAVSPTANESAGSDTVASCVVVGITSTTIVFRLYEIDGNSPTSNGAGNISSIFSTTTSVKWMALY